MLAITFPKSNQSLKRKYSKDSATETIQGQESVKSANALSKSQYSSGGAVFSASTCLIVFS